MEQQEAQSLAVRGKVRKRRRPALSCVPCHRRKLKCDRGFPACERCRKTNQAQDCVYHERAVQKAVAAGKPSSLARAIHEEDAIAQSCVPETRMSLPTPEESCHTQAGEGDEAHFQEVIIYKGKDFLTKFYGYSYHRNLYQQFGQLREYIQRVKAQYPSINNHRDEIQRLKINAHHLKSQAGGMRVACDSQLRSLVPARKVADELLNIYITRFEATHRVLHLPTLLKEYNKYWNNPRTIATTSVVQLLLAMATALSLRENLPCDLQVRGRDAISRETAASWIQACESWMSTNPSRRPPHSWTMLASDCLLIIAKRANHIQAHEFWITTGALMRSAMAAGYHREPNSKANISVFHREMRRRLWATIIELDLQASIERGMPPSLRQEDFNSRPPLNINDDAIQEPAQEPLTQMPLEILTDTSFQAIAYRSIGLRLRICALINNSHVETVESHFHDALAMDEEMMTALMTIPTTWMSTAANDGLSQRPVYLRTMLDLLLRQQLLLLHMPFANLGEHHARFGHSRRARLEAATSILSQFKMLVDYGILPPSACSNCQFQAALAVCHELYLKNVAFGSAAALYASPCLAKAFISLAERVLPMIESRISILAKGLNEYYVLTMVLGLVKSRMWPECRSSFGTEAFERITRIMLTLGSIRTLVGRTTEGLSLPSESVLTTNISPELTDASTVPGPGPVLGDGITAVSFPNASVDGDMWEPMDSSTCVDLLAEPKQAQDSVLMRNETNPISQDFDLFPDDLDLSSFDTWAWAPEDDFFASANGTGDFDYPNATEKGS